MGVELLCVRGTESDCAQRVGKKVRKVKPQ